MRKGFTLIELLVVVLIIGILTAIALPSYQLTVAKARTAEILPLLDAIRKAQEIYYMSNGSYCNTWSDLGVEISGVSNVRDCIVGTIETQCFFFNGYSCSMNSWGNSASCSSGTGKLPQVGVNFAHGRNKTNFGQNICIAEEDDKWMNRVCMALGGKLGPSLGAGNNYYSF